jgi:UDP-N-acetyl-D-galactosamine dehydrogenase
MTQKRIHIVDARILVLGLAFKEDCPDLRNTRVTDIIDELTTCNAKVDVYDPWVSKAEAKAEFDLDLVEELTPDTYDAIIIAVAHSQFKAMPASAIRKLTRDNGIIFDIKYILPEADTDSRL